MIICQCNNHDRANDDLTVDNDSSVFDRVDTENSGLGKVDAEGVSLFLAASKLNGIGEEIETYIGVPKREPKTPPLEIVKVPPDISSRPSLLSLA